MSDEPNDTTSKTFVSGLSLFRTVKGIAEEEWKRLESVRPDLLRKKDQMTTKNLRIKSNTYRERNVSFSNPSGGPDLHCYFDSNGMANVPVHMRYVIEHEMRWSPGRYSFVEEEAPVVVKKVEPPVQRIKPQNSPVQRFSPEELVLEESVEQVVVEEEVVTEEVPEAVAVPKPETIVSLEAVELPKIPVPKKRGRTPKKKE